MNSLKKNEYGSGEKNVLHRKLEIEKKIDTICESENKISHYEKNHIILLLLGTTRCYCADKNINHCDNKTSFKNFNTCTNPGI